MRRTARLFIVDDDVVLIKFLPDGWFYIVESADAVIAEVDDVVEEKKIFGNSL